MALSLDELYWMVKSQDHKIREFAWLQLKARFKISSMYELELRLKGKNVIPLDDNRNKKCT